MQIDLGKVGLQGQVVASYPAFLVVVIDGDNYSPKVGIPDANFSVFLAIRNALNHQCASL